MVAAGDKLVRQAVAACYLCLKKDILRDILKKAEIIFLYLLCFPGVFQPGLSQDWVKPNFNDEQRNVF